MQRSRAHQTRFALGKFSRRPIRKRVQQILADHEAKNRIAEEFQLFVVVAAAGRDFLLAGAVGEGAFQPLRFAERVADGGFQLLAVVVVHGSETCHRPYRMGLRPMVWEEPVA